MKRKNKDMEIDFLKERTDFLFKALLWICFFGLMIGVALILLFCLIMDKPTVSYCNIGEKNIAGDFKTSDWDQYSCAVQDCVAYNKYQKEIGSERMCVV